MDPLTTIQQLSQQLKNQCDILYSRYTSTISEVNHANAKKYIQDAHQINNTLLHVQDQLDAISEFIHHTVDEAEIYLSLEDGSPFYKVMEGRDWDELTNFDNHVDSLVKRVAKDADRTKHSDRMKKKKIGKYEGIKFNAVDIPEVDSLDDIPSMFYYFRGNDSAKEGIYAAVGENLHVRVPIVELYKQSDQSQENNGSRCVISNCEVNRTSNRFKRELSCNYVHKGEKYCRIGISQRCTIEDFGKLDCLESHIKQLNDQNIRSLLLNSLPDMFYLFLWSSKQSDTKSYTNLEDCV